MLFRGIELDQTVETGYFEHLQNHLVRLTDDQFSVMWLHQFGGQKNNPQPGTAHVFQARQIGDKFLIILRQLHHIVIDLAGGIGVKPAFETYDLQVILFCSCMVIFIGMILDIICDYDLRSLIFKH